MYTYKFLKLFLSSYIYTLHWSVFLHFL